MTANKSNPIIGITLEGFQVFDKPTYIPLDRLTLLFGPNSAGKSAVQDAIELYASLLSDDEHGSKSTSPGSMAKMISFMQPGLNCSTHELLERHWRRSGGDDDQWVDTLSLGVTHTTQCSLHDSLGDTLDRRIWGEFLAYESDAYQLESRWVFHRVSDESELTYRSNFEFYIERQLLVRHSHSELGVNLAHPLLSQTELKVDFAEVARSYPDLVSLNDGYLAIRGIFEGFHPKGIHSIQMHDTKTYKPPSQDQPLLLAALSELELLMRELLQTATGNSRFKPSVVEASRTVPTRRELIFQFGNLDDQIEPLLPMLNQSYRLLAASIAHLPLDIQERSLWNRDGVSSYGERVNRALSNHLFIEQGYCIDHDFRVLMSKVNSQSAVAGQGLNPDEFGYVVELFLRDGRQRKHLFEDVGSGIGYVLPVLCAAFESNAISATCFIQQPELHIHPALQAAMGDVFVEASAAEKQLLIETHSEHLLLRILKRIRQTHLQVAIAPELKINADDVCVLYFDPSPDGTTTVKRLRITEDGEFMDRWPRGFFGERDQELLDE